MKNIVQFLEVVVILVLGYQGLKYSVFASKAITDYFTLEFGWESRTLIFCDWLFNLLLIMSFITVPIWMLLMNPILFGFDTSKWLSLEYSKMIRKMFYTYLWIPIGAFILYIAYLGIVTYLYALIIIPIVTAPYYIIKFFYEEYFKK